MKQVQCVRGQANLSTHQNQLKYYQKLDYMHSDDILETEQVLKNVLASKIIYIYHIIYKYLHFSYSADEKATDCFSDK